MKQTHYSNPLYSVEFVEKIGITYREQRAYIIDCVENDAVCNHFYPVDFHEAPPIVRQTGDQIESFMPKYMERRVDVVHKICELSEEGETIHAHSASNQRV